MRRSAGEGSPRKRTDGRWEWSVMLNGKRHYVYGKTKSEAKTKYEALKMAHLQGMQLGTTNQRVDDYLQQWLRDVVQPSLRPRTVQYYESLIYTYIIPAVGSHKLRDLNPQHVQKMVNTLPTHLKPNSVRNIRSVLRRALNVALRWRLVTYNAAHGIVMPKIEKYTPRIPTIEEADKFRAVIVGHPREALYVTALCLGLRRGELLGLLREDVCIETKTICVTGQIQMINKKPERVSLKTEAAYRTLPIPDILLPLLKHAHALHPDQTLLFPSEAGTPILPRNLVTQFKGLLRKAGLPDTIRLHDFRHYAASILLSHGADVVTTQTVLGHADASTTLKYYAHAIPNTVRDVVNDVVNRTMKETTNEATPQQAA